LEGPGIGLFIILLLLLQLDVGAAAEADVVEIEIGFRMLIWSILKPIGDINILPIARLDRPGSAPSPIRDDGEGNFPAANNALAMSDPIISPPVGPIPTVTDGETLVLAVLVLLVLTGLMELGTMFGTSRLTRSSGDGVAVTGMSGWLKTLFPLSVLLEPGDTISHMKPQRTPSL